MRVEPAGPGPDGVHASLNIVKDAYARKKGERRTYDYEGSWLITEQGIVWEAKVRHDGELVGTPSGILLAGSDNPRESVKALVERAIEDLAGIDE
jgi:hypothetical protein